MNQNNFLVRPHLQLVERFRGRSAWDSVSIGDLGAVAADVAALSTQVAPEPEDAKHFDLLMLRTQLCTLTGGSFERDRRKVVASVSALDDEQSIPVIAAQLDLILDIQSDEWWIDVSYSILGEHTRLRLLVSLIERSKRVVINSDLADEIGHTATIALPGTGGNIGSPELQQFVPRPSAS